MTASIEKKTPPLPNLRLLSQQEAAIVADRWYGDPWIPVPGDYNLESEATAFFKAADCPNSPYFTARDYYHMYSHGSLSILPCFRTYQQTRGYTCASAVALMVLYHFGVTSWQELQIADAMAALHGLPSNTRRPIPVSDLVGFFKGIGWDVQSNLASACKVPEDVDLPPWRMEECLSFPTLDSFSLFLRETLASGAPVMVENIDWGAHWRVIIGYDDMGTGNSAHGVLILADPHDTADHCQDGYVVEHVDKFYSTWYDTFVMPREERAQPWVVARPAGKS